MKGDHLVRIETSLTNRLELNFRFDSFLFSCTKCTKPAGLEIDKPKKKEILARSVVVNKKAQGYAKERMKNSYDNQHLMLSIFLGINNVQSNPIRNKL
ncbi:hypothetical protein BpHYR1_011498 [Brachionus plicatilis]|uniref:Uncharacterized protein n=1 Tax=Brachionus plicatilis TaxID=10195 RepID=A0A3M7S4C6_BRAPC|nr:hypothetical protein BpHYR1_011498 [Brachionus plicatilis]